MQRKTNKSGEYEWGKRLMRIEAEEEVREVPFQEGLLYLMLRKLTLS